MSRAWKRALLAGATLLGTGPLWAAGQITGLQLTPTPACKGEPVTATVAGSGNCNKVVIRWEGTGPQAVKDVLQPPPPFPIHQQHVYDHTGQVTVKVAGGNGSNCQGQKQKSLAIQDCGGDGGGGITIDPGLICKMVGCGGSGGLTIKPGVVQAFASLPRITGALGVLQGNAPLIVGGKNFGDAPGTVWIETANGNLHLIVSEWHDGGIGGKVPGGLESYCPTGNIWVETSKASGSKTSLPYKMMVPWEVKPLPYQDVKVVSCGTDGNVDRCNNHNADSPDAEFTFFQGLNEISSGSQCKYAGASACGLHYNNWGAIGDDSGTDTFEISLKNGWVIDSATFESYVEEGEGYTIPSSGVLPSGLGTSSSYWKPQIQWSVTPNDQLTYGLWVTIAGPRCSSYK